MKPISGHCFLSPSGTPLDEEDINQTNMGELFVRVRGGTVGAEAKRGHVREWCSMYSLPVAPSWSIERYSVEHSIVFATEWCARMQWFYNIWAVDVEDGRPFSKSELDSYVASEAWVVLSNSCDGASVLKPRVEDIGRLRPKNP